MKPFRWDISKREQLGRLVSDDVDVPQSPFVEELRACAAKVVARAENRALAFVGRSPESLFDYLCGVFSDSEWEQKLLLVNVSNRFEDVEGIKRNRPLAYAGLIEHFQDLGLSPSDIATHSDGVCFCDLVSSGGTFRQIYEFLRLWSREVNVDPATVHRKLAFVGVTSRTKNSPNTWRWQQNCDWVGESGVPVKNVSVSWQLWDYLGNTQAKVARRHPPERWGDPDGVTPPREDANVDALRRAYGVFLTGRSQKRRFASELAAQWEVRQPWLRELVSVLRLGAQP